MSKVRWDETEPKWLLLFLCLQLFEINFRKGTSDLNWWEISQNSPSLRHIKSWSRKEKTSTLKPLLKVRSTATNSWCCKSSCIWNPWHRLSSLPSLLQQQEELVFPKSWILNYASGCSESRFHMGLVERLFLFCLVVFVFSSSTKLPKGFGVDLKM